MEKPEKFTEPENSWEISFILELKRPKIRLGIPKGFVWTRVIPRERLKELLKWSDTNEFNSFWVKEHR